VFQYRDYKQSMPLTNIYHLRFFRTTV